MSNLVVNYYRLFCNTENCLVYTWNTSTPTCCPNNNAHSINTSSVSVINTISQNSVNVIQTNSNTGTNYRCNGESFTIDANSTREILYSWPINLSIMTVNFTTDSSQTNDVINCYVSPNTTIGVLTQNLTTSDTNIHVSDTVIKNISLGYIVTITDGVNTAILNECISIDNVNNIINCELPSSFNFNAGSLVQMTIQTIKNYIIGLPSQIHLATKSIGTSFLPKNTNVKICYTNNSNVTKTFCYYFECFY